MGTKEKLLKMAAMEFEQVDDFQQGMIAGMVLQIKNDKISTSKPIEIDVKDQPKGA